MNYTYFTKGFDYLQQDTQFYFIFVLAFIGLITIAWQILNIFFGGKPIQTQRQEISGTSPILEIAPTLKTIEQLPEITKWHGGQA